MELRGSNTGPAQGQDVKRVPDNYIILLGCYLEIAEPSGSPIEATGPPVNVRSILLVSTTSYPSLHEPCPGKVF